MTSPSLTAAPVKQRARPQSAFQRIGVPGLLFVVTVCSTTAVGMRYMHNFRLGQPPLASDADILPYAWVWANLHGFAAGIPFSFTLIAILLAHEFGHYFACRAFNVRATLPYLLPAPSLSGSFGAVIRLRSRVRSRAALIVIGAAGPIAGFLVAIVAIWYGLVHSTYASARVVSLQAPLLITMLHGILRHTTTGPMPPPLHLIVPHPVLTASWIGLLITALNLIPAGQLDGGHIVYAISPMTHKVSSRLSTVALVLLGVFCWAPWLLWAVILMLPSMRHPQVPDVGEIRPWHYALVPVCALVLMLAGTYQPFMGYSLLNYLHIR
jgi:Zn-dependent protease